MTESAITCRIEQMTAIKQSGSGRKKHSILGLLPLFKAVETQGLDPDLLVKRRGLSLDSVTGAAVIDQELELAIVADALQLLDDPLLGLRVGNQTMFTSYGTYAMLLMTAPNIIEAAKAGAQFQSLSLLFSHMALYNNKEYLELRFTLPDVSPSLKSFIADRDMAGTFLFMREFMERTNHFPLSAGVARLKPQGQYLAEYRKYLDSPVEFEQSYNWIRVPASVLRVQQKHANTWAHKVYRVQAYELMRKFYPVSDDVVTRITQFIEGFDSHYPPASEVADMLGFSDRTLHRKLLEANTSYRQLIEAHKKNRAFDMLVHKGLQVAEIAEALGYAESASFLRAFKRWTGMTPKKYAKLAEESKSMPNGQPG